MMIGNLNIPSEFIPALVTGLWLTGGGVVLSVVLNAVKLFRSLSNKGERREVAMVEEVASKSELTTHIQFETQEFARIQEELKEMKHERKADMTGLHQRIDRVEKDVGGLQASSDLMNQRLVQIDSKLDRAIERSALA